MLADGDQLLNGVAAYTLNRYGYNVIKAVDSNQAWQRWIGEDPDLVVVDVAGALTQARSLSADPRVVTGRPHHPDEAASHDDDLVRGFECGADDYIVKPFSMRQLLLRLQALSRRALTDDRVNARSGIRAGGRRRPDRRSCRIRGAQERCSSHVHPANCAFSTTLPGTPGASSPRSAWRLLPGSHPPPATAACSRRMSRTSARSWPRRAEPPSPSRRGRAGYMLEPPVAPAALPSTGAAGGGPPRQDSRRTLNGKSTAAQPGR
ncbi:MAG: hypothetical protein U0531_13515 [Dehalococcoidia bacterium]